MTSIDKILVVIDPTATAQPALERIAHLPRPLAAQLLLLICESEPHLGVNYALTPEAIAAARASLLARHRKRLEELATPLLAQGLDVRTDVRSDYPLHEAIIRKAVEWGADLVVKDTHHHSVLRRTIFSNTDWNLIRQCPMQLLLVKPRVLGHVPVVVAAVDPLHPRDEAAALDDRILSSANELAHLFAGRTHVLHTFDISPVILTAANGVMTPIALPMAEITGDLEKAHTEAVHALATKHGIPRERVYVLQGHTRELLVSSAERLSADVIVMGAVSRSGLERLFIGSTAESALDKLRCDVLIVKPAGLATSV
jgi:universal stress protein E